MAGLDWMFEDDSVKSSSIDYRDAGVIDIYNDFKSSTAKPIIPSSASEPEQKEDKKNFWDSYAGDFAENFAGGLFNMASGLQRVGLGSIIAASPLDADTQAEISKLAANNLFKKGDRYHGKDFRELSKNDVKGDAIGQIMLETAKSLPQMITAMFAGPAGLVSIGASTTGLKYDRLEDRTDINEIQKISNAVLTGAVEAGSEMLGSVPIGKALRGVYSTVGKEAAEQAVKKGFGSILKKTFKKYGIFLAPIEEGIEEIAATIGENTTDWVTGVEQEYKPFEGAYESFVYGAGGGTLGTVASVPGEVSKAVNKRKQSREVKYTIQENIKPFINPTDGQLHVARKPSKEDPSVMDNFFIVGETEGGVVAVKDIQGNVTQMSRKDFTEFEVIEPTEQSNLEFEAWNQQQSQVEEEQRIAEHHQKKIESMLPGEFDEDGVRYQYTPHPSNVTEEGIMVDELDQDGLPIGLRTVSFDEAKKINEQYQAKQEEEQRIKAEEVAKQQQPVTDQGQPIITETIGKQAFDFTENEDGSLNFVPSEKVSPEKALSTLEKEFADNPKWEVVAEKEQVEVPAQSRFQEPTIETRVKGIRIAPKQEQSASVATDKQNDLTPKYTINGENVTREDAFAVIELADDISDIEGLKIDGDEKLDKQLKKKFPQLNPTYKINGKDVDRNTTHSAIRLANTSDKLARVEVANDPELETVWKERKEQLGLTEVEAAEKAKRDRHNLLVSRVRQFNNKEVKQDSQNQGQIMAMAQELGYKVANDGGKLIITNGNDKQIRAIGENGKAERTLEDIPQEKQGLIKAILPHADFIQTELHPKETREAVERISKGETSANSQRLLDGLEKMVDDGVITIRGDQKTGQPSIQIPVDEYLNTLVEEITPEEQAHAENIPDDMLMPIMESMENEPTMEDLDAFELLFNEIEYKPEDNGQQQEINTGTESTGLQADQTESQVESVNQEQTEQQSVEAKKADIEKRRQEELNANKTKYNSKIENIDVDELDFTELDDGNIEESKQKDVDAYAEKFKKGKTPGAIIIGIGKDGKKYVIDGHRRVFAAKKAGVRTLKAIVRDRVSNDNKGVDYDEIRLLEINAKYDAELAALQNTPQSQAGGSSLLSTQQQVPTPDLHTSGGGSTVTVIEGNVNKSDSENESVIQNENKTSVNTDLQETEIEKSEPKNETSINENDDLFTASEKATERVKIKKEEKKVNTQPSEAQKEAGNYKKGHVQIQGLNISIEQPKGSVRSGKDESGREWSQEMNNTYGYFKRTEGKDGDQVDVFLGDNLLSDKAFIVDQVNKDGSFDEHKTMLGFDNVDQAREAYLSNYEEGWTGLGNISEVPIYELKGWLKDGKRTKKPYNLSVVKDNLSTESKPDQISKPSPVKGNQSVDTTDKVKPSNKKVNPQVDLPQKGDKIKFNLGGREYTLPSGDYSVQKNGDVIFDLFGQKRLTRDQYEIVGESALKSKEVKPEVNHYGSSNKMVTSDRYAELKKRMSNKLGGQLNAGFDPEILAIGAEMAAYHIEAGARKFSDFANRMVSDLGGNIKPYLKSIYNAARDLPGMEQLENDMDSYDSVKQTDVNSISENNNVTLNSDVERRSDNIEPDSPTGGNEKPTDGANVSLSTTNSAGERVDSDSPTGKGDQQVKLEFGDDTFSNGVTDLGSTTVADRESGNNELHTEQQPARSEDGTTRNRKPRGSNDVNPEGKTIFEFAESVANRTSAERTARTAPTKIKLGDLNNITETVPTLYPEQQDDVLKAEKRFFTGENKGKGILFTNGTGTGKTYTGLGIAKRYNLNGKKNILLVVPTDAKAKDWIEDGQNVELEINQLKNTKDAGENAVVTTYANFYQNKALQTRDFDLIIYDESHYLGQNESGETTEAYRAHQVVANLPSKAKAKAAEIVGESPKQPTRPDVHELKQKHDWDESKYLPEYNELMAKYNKKHEKWVKAKKKWDEKLKKETERLHDQTKVVFLSASPFAYHKTLGYGDGTLLDIYETLEKDDYSGRGYNEARGMDKVLTENFGYRMRTDLANQPEAGVDVGLLERNFFERMVKDGIFSGRKLNVDKDYSRDFILVDSELSNKINEGFKLFHSWDNNEFREKYPKLYERAHKKWNYLYLNQLIESIKASRIGERIQQHLDLGRKVVLFHGYNNALPSHPFKFEVSQLYAKGDFNNPELTSEISKARAEISQFESEYSELVNLDLSGLENPRTAIKAQFGDQSREFNGTIPKKKRLNYIEEFNDPNSGVDIFLVQRQAGKEGISLHDKLGNKQRVLIDLGLPTRPTDAIQTEGRTYRLGVMSDAIFEYPVLHTDFEKIAFAMKVATRAKTAENLAMGNMARDLETAFKEGYQNAIEDSPSREQGKGGKELDSQTLNTSEFDQAKTYYFARGKKTSRNKSQEGVDYFATPEPLGYKMAEWLGLRPNEHALEPSAGHGAIARFFPGTTNNTFVEPSYTLSSQLSINVNGTVKQQAFEDLHIVNKYNGIAMNPPFGKGGKTAMEHVEKAFKHLHENGRIVAIVPTGPSMQKRLNKFLYGENEKGKLFNPNAKLVAEVSLPGVTFERAGTSVNTKIVVIDKISDPEHAGYTVKRELNYDKIGEFFDAIEDMTIPERNVDQTSEVEQDIEDNETNKFDFETFKQEHSKTGDDLFMASPKEYLGDDYSKVKEIAQSNNGYYSSYQNKAKNIRKGFTFKTEEDRNNFLNEVKSLNFDGENQVNDTDVRYRKKNIQDTATSEDNLRGREQYDRTERDVSTNRRGYDVPNTGTIKRQVFDRVQSLVLNHRSKVFAAETFDNRFSQLNRKFPNSNLSLLADKIYEELPDYNGNNFEDPSELGLSENDLRFRKTNALGFYSTVEDALDKINQEKGTPEQFKSMLLKNGAKQAELDWMDFEDTFSGKKSIAKTDIQDWIDQNRIEVEEVVKGEIPKSAKLSREEALRELDRGNVIYGVDSEGQESVIETLDDLDRYDTWVPDEYYQADRQDGVLPTGDTKYSDYQTPGGENYKEVLLTMPSSKDKPLPKHLQGDQWAKDNGYDPDKIVYVSYEGNKPWKNAVDKFRKSQPEFKSSHFDEPNILAHIRFNERTDSEGNKVLFLEEIQSDWAQKGKKEGFNETYEKDKLSASTDENWSDEIREKFHLIDYRNDNGDVEQRFTILKSQYPSFDEALNYVSTKSKNTQAVPNMPFKQTPQWVNLAMRRMIRYAAENGFDKVAWTNGEMQAGRYDLSKQVDYINLVNREKNGGILEGEKPFVIYAHKDGQGVFNQKVDENELEGIIGKEAAKKLIESPVNEFGNRTLEGEDLKVGGEGMKAFYDKIVPNLAGKIGKKFKAKVEPIELDLVDYENGDANKDTVQSISITDKMVSSVMEGIPLFRDPNATIFEQVEQNNKVYDQRHQQAQQVADKLGKELNTPVKVVRSVNDLPRNIRRQINRADAKGVYGVFNTADGAVYLVSNNIESQVEAEKTILHEVVGHKGLRGLLGERFTPIMREVYDSMSDETKAEMKERLGTDNWLELADEHMAELAEEVNPPTWYQKILTKIRNLIRSIFPSQRLNRSDLKNMIRASRKLLSAPRPKDFDSVFDFAEAQSEYIRARKVQQKDSLALDKKVEQITNKASNIERKKETHYNSTLLKNKIKDLEMGWNLGERDTKKSIDKLQNEVVKYAQANMPTDKIGKRNVMYFMRSVKNATTPQKLERSIDLIDNVINGVDIQRSIDNINKILKENKPKKVNGKPSGTLDPDVYAVLDKIREIKRLDSEESLNNYLENLDESDIESVALFAQFSNLEEKSREDLFNAEKVLTEMVTMGKVWYKDAMEEKKKYRAKLRKQAINKITGGKGIISEQEYRAKGNLPKESAFKEYLYSNQSFEWLLDVISKDKSENTAKGWMQDYFGDVVNNATNKESKGIRETTDVIHNKASEIFGKDKRKLAKVLAKNSIKDENSGVTFMSRSGERLPLDMSQNEAYKKWMEMQDPALDATFKNMGWDNQTKVELESFMTPQIKQWAEWQLREFYPSYYKGVNDKFKKAYFVNLPFNENYSPVKRVVSEVADKDDAVLKKGSMLSGVGNASLKSRVSNINDLHILDGDQILAMHVSEMEHFKAWVDEMSELRSVFGSRQVQHAIKYEHGNNLRKILNRQINDFASGGRDRADAIQMIDRIRRAFVTAELGLNYTLFPKQLVSGLTYMSEMPVTNYIEGMMNLAFNFRTVINTLKDSELIKNRYKQGWTHEVHAAMKKNVPTKLSGSKSLLNGVRDVLMIPTKAGDYMGILGGWSVYNYEYKKAKAKGKSDNEAHEYALNKFERSVSRSQQSAALKDTSELQKGSIGKLFTMFKNSQQQYSRYEVGAIRNLMKGRGSVKDNLKTLALFHVLLPVAFQLVANAFTDDDDDQEKKRLLRAGALGSLNGLLIASDIFEFLLEKVMGERWNYSATPLEGSVNNMGYGAYNISTGIQGDDQDKVLKGLEQLGYGLNNMTIGLPYRPAKKIIEKVDGVNHPEIKREKHAKSDYSKLKKEVAHWKKEMKQKGNDYESYEDFLLNNSDWLQKAGMVKQAETRLRYLAKQKKAGMINNEYEYLEKRAAIMEQAINSQKKTK